MNSRRFNFLRFNDWPLATKLTATVLTLLVLITAMVNIVVLVVLQRSMTDQIGNNLRTLAESRAAVVSRDISEVVSDLQDFARNRTIITDVLDANAAYPDQASAAQQQLLRTNARWESAVPGDALILSRQNLLASNDMRTFVNADPNHSEVFVTDRLGGLVAITVAPRKYDQSAELWWAAAYNNGDGTVFVSPPVYDTTANIYIITVAVPVYRPNSTEVIGILHSNYRLFNIVNELSAIQIGQTGETMLLTRAGLRLDTTAGDNVRVGFDEWENVLRDANTGYYIGTFDTRDSFVTVAPVSGTGDMARLSQLEWFLVVRQDSDESLAAQRNIVTIGAGVAIAGILLLSLFTINVARTMVRPIAELTNTARQAQGGNLSVSAPVRSQDEVGQLSEAFNAMIGEIRGLTGSLEAEVTERTAQLSAVNDIASAVTGTLDLPTVLSTTVNLIRDRLGYYQVSIFLLDERGENATVRESTGEVGRILKERAHTLGVGSQSIIGFVTGNRRPRIALDTGLDAVHFKNPLLPDTRSEMALPLIVGETLFGALDVQSTEPNAFDEQDVAVLQNMANQIASAINNARLYQETQARIEEISTLNRQYLSRAWESFVTDRPDAVNLQLDGGLVSPAPHLSVRRNPITITTPVLTDDGQSISIPIILRDEIIGEFSLSAPASEGRWGEDELALVDAVVAQVALAVENARLLEETQVALGEANRLARRERIISDISNKISFGSDVRRILQIAADELRRATGSSRAVVKLTGAEREPQPEAILNE
jgi:GAF domain-containing protein/HAMP domain-containing protein